MTLVPASSGKGMPLALPGATAATRYMGGTITGVPTTGTFAVGDYVIAETEATAYVCWTAGTPGLWRPVAMDPLMIQRSYLTWTYPPFGIAGNSILTSQTIYCVELPTIAGMSYTGVKLYVQTPGTGLAPTAFYVGLASYANIAAAGTMLAQSADLSASANLTAGGVGTFAFSAPYVETVTGPRVVTILENGAFGGTALQLCKAQSLVPFGATSSPWIMATANTGVAALPANGVALANYASANALSFWAALY